MNSEKGKETSTTYGTMEAWTASKNGILFPFISAKFLRDTEMGEIMI